MFKNLMLTLFTFSLVFTAAKLHASPLGPVVETQAPIMVTVNKTQVLANVCGNGIVEEGEVCDGGNNCSGDCKGGILHSDAPSNAGTIQKVGENSKVAEITPTTPSEDGPGYQVNPQGESGHQLAPLDKPEVAPLPGPAACGNGTVESGEACDDGNTLTGDGCSSVCKFEDSSDQQPLVDKQPQYGSRHEEDSAIVTGGMASLQGGCSLQAGADSRSAGPLSALAMTLLLAIPARRLMKKNLA